MLNIGVVLLPTYEAVFALLLRCHYLINYIHNDSGYRPSQLGSQLGQLFGLYIGAVLGGADIPPLRLPFKPIRFTLRQMGIHKTHYLSYFFFNLNSKEAQSHLSMGPKSKRS